MPDIETFADVDITSTERTSLRRLSENKDFMVLCDILMRWQMKRGLDLIRTRVEGQEVDLISHQGGFELYRRMVKYVDEAGAIQTKNGKK